MDYTVIDNPSESRFEMAVGKELAIAEYRIEGNKVLLTHTEVPEALGGQGIGSKLAKGVFEAIRDSGRHAVPLCSFMAAWVARHSEFADIVDG